ncbi:membrane-associated protein, putative [Bodo saltans]|uniref:Membrane-associated protein, putative n=1 Tax=Bodo saltans TaxID=75058 RepID=A0A0S4J0S9_BODSA|nr:membrane-associated protein, putative [Bodo saltans]|eukprot:CUG06522.1 membrane-associated protein, putative [Bodo saltans]
MQEDIKRFLHVPFQELKRRFSLSRKKKRETRKMRVEPVALWLCVFVLLIHCINGHTFVQRPPVIKLGIYYNMSNPDISFDGVQLYAGAQAAVKELNDLQTVPGVTFELEYIPAATVSASNATSSVFAIVASDWYSSASLAQADAGFPVVGPRSLGDNVGVDSSYHMLSVRQPLSSESLMVLHNALNSEQTRSTAFVMVTRPFMNSSTFVSALASLSLPAPLEIALGSSPLDAASVLSQWSSGDPNNGNFVPTCGVFFTTQPDTSGILEAMYADLRFNMSQMRFYVVGPAAEGVWNSSSAGTAPFTRLRFVTSFSDPASGVNPLSQRYQSALSAWFADADMSALPADMTSRPLIRAPTYAGLEGYVGVRLVGETLSLMGLLNQTLFLEAVYRRRYLFLNDAMLGPFSDGCLIDSDISIPCSCNVGMRTAQLAMFSPTTGRAQHLPYDSYYDPNSVKLTEPVEECYLQLANLKFPLPFALWYDTLQVAMKAMSYHYNTDINHAGFASATYMPAIMQQRVNESLMAFEDRLYATRRPIAIIGDQFRTVHHHIANLYVSPTTEYIDADLQPATETSRYTWVMKPYLSELVHAVALHVADYYAARQPPVIFVGSDNAVGYRVAVQSLHTVQFAVEDGDATNVRHCCDVAAAECCG